MRGWKREQANKLWGALTRQAVRLTSLLLTGAMLLPMLPQKAGAAASDYGELEQLDTNTYALQVSTGVVSTRGSLADEILYFKVVYEDEDGYTRSHRIFPGENALEQSDQWAAGQAGSQVTLEGYAQEDGQNTVSSAASGSDTSAPAADQSASGAAESTGAAPEGDAGTAAAPAEEIDMAATAEKLGVTIQDSKPFQPYSTDTFFFQPLKKVKSIQRIEVLMCDQVTESADRTNGSWTCQAMRVYQVDAIKGMKMYGGISSRRYADFSGWLIAEMDQPHTFNWTKDDIFQIAVGGGEDGSLAQVQERYDTRTTDRVFRFDIADSYGAGIRALGNATGKSIYDSRFGECAALDVRYTDIYGAVREAYLPVVTNVLAYALANGVSGETKLSGIAQDGDTLAMGASLPDFQELSSIRLIYGSQAAQAAAGITVAASSEENRTVQPESAAGSDVDLLSLTGFSVYDPAAANVSVSVPQDDTMLRAEFQGSPLSYYRVPSVSGDVIRPVEQGNAGVELRLENYEQGANLLPTDKSERYLVMLKTDDKELAGTTADLEMTLNYTDLNGREQNSGAISVREAVESYYGEWPGVRRGFMYRAGMRGGGELYFTVSLKDVDKFTGVRFRLTDGSNDWQMQSMEIYRLDSLSSLSARWETVSDGDQTSDRQYYRSFTGASLKVLNDTILVDGREQTGVDFDSDSTVDVKDTGDWSQYRYSMSYENAQTLSSFAKSRYQYVVGVEVGSDQVTDATDGDCGSKNQFYFQLVFQDGKSAYVLANQQLAADGFRSGCTENFTISTNRDMGELTAVKILPEDTANKSDVFDKLKIESIRVKKQTNEAVSRQWIIDHVGWIDINYQDDAATSSNLGYNGRSEAELVRTYQVDSSTYVVNLEFAITTGAYDVSSTDPDQVDQQLYGQLYGVVEYYDSNGTLKSQSYDLVQAMYDYNGKEAKTGKAETIGQYPWPGGVESDTGTMFRPGKTDRFTLGIEDISQLLRVTLQVRSKVPTTWNVENVYVSLAGSGGRRVINAQDEYQWVDTEGGEKLCSSMNSGQKAYSLHLPLNQVQSTTVTFTENHITWEDSEKGQISSVTSRLPRSADDSLNVYVYLADGQDDLDLSGITMTAGAQYSRVFGGLNRVERQLLPAERDGVRLFYANGLSASGIDTLTRLELLAYFNDLNANGQVLLDHAVVQQVRSGVVINSYYVDFAGCDAASDNRGVSREPSTQTGTYQFKQTVTLGFGDMPSTRLTAESDDVAVALQYTTTNDVTAQEYESPFIYLTDQQWTQLWSGRVVDLTFHEAYVKEITGIKIRCTGHGTRNAVRIDSATAAVYETDDAGNDYQTGQFSFAKGVSFSSGSGDRVMACTARDGAEIGGVGELDLTFAVPKAEDVPKAAENADGAVGMVLNYRKTNGATAELRIYDIRTYAADGAGSFAPGSTMTMRLLLPEAEEVRWISLSPSYEAGNEGTLTLSSVTAAFSRGGKSTTYQRSLADWNGSGRIPVSNAIQVKLNAATVDQTTGAQTRIDTGSGTSSPLVQSGQKVVITPVVTGSEGYTVRVEKYRGDFAVEAPETITRNGDTITFQASNEWTSGPGETISYRITIASTEVPDLQTVLNIGVEPKIVTPPAAETPSGEENQETPGGGENSAAEGNAAGT